MEKRISCFKTKSSLKKPAVHKKRICIAAALVCIFAAAEEPAAGKKVTVRPPVPAEHVKTEAALFSASAVSIPTLATPVPAAVSSGFIRPATGRITSEYGPRNGRMHHGIDIGRGGRMNVPVTAAAPGKVVEAKYRNGYGNTVMVSHRMNGREMMTLYAHLASIGVAGGQTVAQGEKLGLMGNTGASRGPHLHFEIHEGSWDTKKSRSVNPRKYVDF